MIVLLTQYSQSSGGGGGAGGMRASNGGASGLKPYQTRAGKARAYRLLRNEGTNVIPALYERELASKSGRNIGAWARRPLETYAQRRAAIRARPVLGGRKPEKYATAFNF